MMFRKHRSPAQAGVQTDGETGPRPAPGYGYAASDRQNARLPCLLRRIGPVRLLAAGLFLLLALLLARLSWDLPLTDDVERMLYDFRASQAVPSVEQDDRITMVVYNDQTLIATGRRSPLDRVTLARALERLDAMRPKAIGIDILIDQQTPEDEVLIAAFRGMRTPTYLAFASAETNAENIAYEQEQFIRDFLKRIGNPAVRPASVLFETDNSDNVIRNWPRQPPSLPPLLSNAMTPVNPEFRDYTGAIRFRQPADPERPVFAKLPIDLFTADIPVEVLQPQIEGRFILIGGDIFDLDRFETPQTRGGAGQMIGLEVHAHMLAQLLDGVRYAMPSGWLLWLAAAIVVAAGALTAMADLRPRVVAPLLIAQAAIVAWLPYFAQDKGIDTQQLPVFGWGAGWVLAFVAVASASRSMVSQQRHFAQSALGRYLPRDVAAEILRDPDSLALHGEKREIYALFTDLEGFTKLSHAVAPEMVAFLLNRYLDMLSDVVLKHGGTIDKFVGDAVVAFWGAPIARPDDAERAVAAAIGMYEAGERFRREAPEGVPPIGCTRVGLHFGEAIVGNFGGEGRIQYTALGDSMNLAARLESANKQLKTIALISETVVRRTDAALLRPMGRVSVRGRSTPIMVYEPAKKDSEQDVTRLTALVSRFDQGDDQALKELERFAAEHPDDMAIACLVERLRHTGAGGSFVLD